MRNIRNFVVLFLLVLGAIALNAQSVLHGEFKLSSEARWGNAVLPAGEYTFTIDSVQSPIVIQSANGNKPARVMAQKRLTAAPGGSYIFITGTGANREVRSMNLPQLGVSLVYRSLTARERETLYVSASQTIPIMVAKK